RFTYSRSWLARTSGEPSTRGRNAGFARTSSESRLRPLLPPHVRTGALARDGTPDESACLSLPVVVFTLPSMEDRHEIDRLNPAIEPTTANPPSTQSVGAAPAASPGALLAAQNGANLVGERAAA